MDTQSPNCGILFHSSDCLYGSGAPAWTLQLKTLIAAAHREAKGGREAAWSAEGCQDAWDAAGPDKWDLSSGA